MKKYFSLLIVLAVIANIAAVFLTDKSHIDDRKDKVKEDPTEIVQDTDTPDISVTETDVIEPTVSSDSSISTTAKEEEVTGNDSEPDTEVTGSDVNDPQPDTTGLTLGDKGYEVSRTQQRLNKLGYGCGNPDGTFGQNTRRAISVFQRDAGIPVSGTLNSETKELLFSDSAPAAPLTYDHEDVRWPDIEKDYYIIVYKKNCSVLVLKKDDYGKFNQIEKIFRCSVGISNGHGTISGRFSVKSKHEWRMMNDGTYAQYITQFKGHYLFHSLPYLSMEKDSMMMEEYEKLGTEASHGCVRLTVEDAKWIYDNAKEGTQVSVLNDIDGPETTPVPELIYDDEHKGWDPTDPDPDNPYL